MTDDPHIDSLISDPSNSMRFAFNTIVLRTQGTSLVCDSTQTTMLFENNIIAARGTNQPSAITGDGCDLINNLIDPQVSPPANNLTGDPQFVSVENKDYRVSITSPALDAGDPGLTITSDHAFDAVARPQGAGPDIGAFEQ